MSEAGDSQDELKREVYALADACRQGDASSADAARLQDLVCNNPAARRWYVEFVYDSISLRRRGLTGEAAADSPLPSADIDPELLAAMQGERQNLPAAPIPSNIGQPTLPGVAAPGAAPMSPRGAPGINFLRSAFTIVAHPYTLWSLVAIVAVGMLAMVFWPAATHGPGPVATGTSGPAATLARATGAKWQAGFAPAGNTLAAGQRLMLETGTAEITFKNQARVILEAPAEFTIVDAGACRLADGKLTAHVPKPARGFKVNTPDGTVTDLGTEFGVLVSGQLSVVRGKRNSEPTADSRQPIASSCTEVHVFLGQVSLTDADQLLQNPADPQSQIPNRKSQILSAGQAATITANEVKALPAADPFKFSPEAFDGRSRKTLLADDFEALPLGAIGGTTGWKTAYATKKEIRIVDPAAGTAGVSSPQPSVGHSVPPVGHRVM